MGWVEGRRRKSLSWKCGRVEEYRIVWAGLGEGGGDGHLDRQGGEGEGGEGGGEDRQAAANRLAAHPGGVRPPLGGQVPADHGAHGVSEEDWFDDLQRELEVEESCDQEEVNGDADVPGPGEAEGVGGAELPDHRQGRHRHAVHEVPSHWVPWVEVEHKEAGEGVTQLPGAEVCEGSELAEGEDGELQEDGGGGVHGGGEGARRGRSRWGARRRGGAQVGAPS